jgi:hypothetical protein
MSDPIRLYLDEDTSSRALILALRSRSVDVLTAQESNLIQASDERHLEYAASLGRHAGIIVSDQAQVGVLARRLLKLLAARSAAEAQDRLEFLSAWR